MKLMFNETGGQKVNAGMFDCKYCVFHHSKWCYSIYSDHPLYRLCGSEIYKETSLDIFKL
jgi:hypothetical protein